MAVHDFCRKLTLTEIELLSSLLGLPRVREVNLNSRLIHHMFCPPKNTSFSCLNMLALSTKKVGKETGPEFGCGRIYFSDEVSIPV